MFLVGSIWPLSYPVVPIEYRARWYVVDPFVITTFLFFIFFPSLLFFSTSLCFTSSRQVDYIVNVGWIRRKVRGKKKSIDDKYGSRFACECVYIHVHHTHTGNAKRIGRSIEFRVCICQWNRKHMPIIYLCVCLCALFSLRWLTAKVNQFDVSFYFFLSFCPSHSLSLYSVRFVKAPRN